MARHVAFQRDRHQSNSGGVAKAREWERTCWEWKRSRNQAVEVGDDAVGRKHLIHHRWHRVLLRLQHWRARKNPCHSLRRKNQRKPIRRMLTRPSPEILLLLLLLLLLQIHATADQLLLLLALILILRLFLYDCHFSCSGSKESARE